MVLVFGRRRPSFLSCGNSHSRHVVGGILGGGIENCQEVFFTYAPIMWVSWGLRIIFIFVLIVLDAGLL